MLFPLPEKRKGGEAVRAVFVEKSNRSGCLVFRVQRLFFDMQGEKNERKHAV
jgi:hypothetical protein